MSLFSKILNEKLKKEKAIALEESNSRELNFDISDGLSAGLHAWLKGAPLTKRSYYNIENSSYSIYKKDAQELEKQREEREKREIDDFITRFHSEKQREAVRFFFEQGARSFMNMSLAHLKKDYKKLALKLHPDRHFNEIPSVQRQFLEDFRRLSESYDILFSLFSE